MARLVQAFTRGSIMLKRLFIVAVAGSFWAYASLWSTKNESYALMLGPHSSPAKCEADRQNLSLEIASNNVRSGRYLIAHCQDLSSTARR